MKPIRDDKSDYLSEVKRRAKESHIYREYQLTGLEIARLLEDNDHKSLYIKLCKYYKPGELMQLAKETAEARKITNKGGYFMYLLHKKYGKIKFK